MFNSFVNPIAIEAIGWKYYLVYIALLAIFSVVVYLFYAETKGYSLEEISDVFEGPSIAAGRIRRRRNHPDHEGAAHEKDPHVTQIENVVNAKY
jgi:hypothetical protein